MIPSRKNAAVLLAALACAAVSVSSVCAQLYGQSSASPPATAPSTSPVRTLIVLDPAHGASDSGAVLGDHVLEKDITLAIASRLRAALTANGFTVVATRDADPADPLSTDQRAETANRAHAVACIVIHAAAIGSGVHLYTSTLPPPAPDTDAQPPSAYVPVPWNTAQAAFVRQSADLASALNTTLGKAHLPALVGQAPIRPLDNLMCPAIAIELAPLMAPGVGATPATDTNYQQQVANAMAGALRAWRDTSRPSPSAETSPHGQTTAQGKAMAAADVAGRTAAKARTSAAAAQPQAGQKVTQ